MAATAAAAARRLLSRRTSSSLFLSTEQLPLRPAAVAAASRLGFTRWMAQRPGGDGHSPMRSGGGDRDRAPTKTEPLFPGCDYKHWFIGMEKPGGKDGKDATKQQMIDCYIQTLAKVLGSEEEAKKKIYNVSCEEFFGFRCEIDEETSNKLEGLPGVLFKVPDSYVDPEYKDYGDPAALSHAAMATKAWSLLRAARKASLASRAAAAAASRAARAADVAADLAALSLAATKASSLLRAVRRTSLASRAAAAAASRAAAAAASRAARAADVATDVARVDRLSLEDLDLTKSCSNPRLPTSVDYTHIPEDSKTPTDKDLESDDAVWALYERWCKAFDKKRDYAAMTYRFEIFRYTAESVYRRNNSVPANPKLAACVQRKRRKVKLLLSKGENVSHFENHYHPAILGPLADGGDPFLRQWDYDFLMSFGKGDARRAPKDDTVE